MTARDSLTTSYAEFFKNPVENPLGHGPRKKAVLASLYHEWRVSGAPTAAGDLLKTILNHFDSKAVGGIGIFVTEPDGQHRLRILHGIRRYSGPLGIPSPLTDKVFGYMGDVSPRGFVEIVQIDEKLFDLTGEVNVCTIAHHKNTLAGDATIDIFKVRGTTTAPASEVIKTRNSAFIPYDLMPLLLTQSLTAHEAFETIKQFVRGVCPFVGLPPCGGDPPHRGHGPERATSSRHALPARN